MRGPPVANAWGQEAALLRLLLLVLGCVVAFQALGAFLAPPDGMKDTPDALFGYSSRALSCLHDAYDARNAWAYSLIRAVDFAFPVFYGLFIAAAAAREMPRWAVLGWLGIATAVLDEAENVVLTALWMMHEAGAEPSAGLASLLTQAKWIVGVPAFGVFCAALAAWGWRRYGDRRRRGGR